MMDRLRLVLSLALAPTYKLNGSYRTINRCHSFLLVFIKFKLPTYTSLLITLNNYKMRGLALFLLIARVSLTTINVCEGS